MNIAIQPDLAGGAARFWDPKQARLRCLSVTAEAPSVRTFRFEAEDRSWFDYAPGQFVTLELPAGPVPVQRSYTLASSPSRPRSVALTVKAQADSVGTRWMFEALRPGMLLAARGPAGRFTLFDHPARRVLFLSAGSGVTPMMSMLRWMADTAPDSDATFVHIVRRPADLLFQAELTFLASLMPGLKRHFVVSEHDPSWPGPTGRLDPRLLARLCPDIADREIFCCGPDRFMSAARAVAAELGAFEPARWHQESFGAAAEPAPSPAAAAISLAAGAEVRFVKSGRVAVAAAGRTIMQAAEDAGLRIPYSCRMGLCGTCQVRMVSGAVRMDHNGGISDRDIAEGYILACCSQPETPTVEVAF